MSPCRTNSARRYSLLLNRILFAAAFIAVAGSVARAQGTAGVPTNSDVHLYARIMSMTDSRTFERKLVDSALAARWRPLRAAATLAVGQTGRANGVAGIPLLHSLLTDADANVASNAAYALGLLHDSTSVVPLTSALGGPDAVAREAAWALGEIGTPARYAITTALAGRIGDESRTIQLLLAAAKLRPVPLTELKRYVAMSDKPSVQWAAAYAIARQRAPGGVSALIALAGDPAFARVIPGETRDRPGASPILSDATANVYLRPATGRQRTRAEIARALTSQAAGDSLGDAAFAVLLRLAKDEHPHVRINAVRSLATYERRGTEAVSAATLDKDANVRITAAQSLATVLDSSAAWTAMWQRDTSLMYRSSVLASAGRAGGTLPAASDWVTHSDWRFRAAALGAAGASRDKAKVAAAASRMIRDADGRVRANAYSLLAGNDTTALEAVVHNQLLAGLADADFYVRATSIGALAAHARAADVPSVLASYQKALGDSGNDARLAAIQYVASAWKRDSVSFSPSLRKQLAALSPSDDPLVRNAADSISFMKSWHSLAGNPGTHAWYEELVRTYVVPALTGKTQRATIRTLRGDIVLELYGADAPITVRNFMNLARTGYYKGAGFHRVVPNFVAQDGDPRGDGNGGPGYSIRDEMNPRRYERGALGMALSGPDTGGSQYFITHSPQPHLDGHYTVFGRVVSGFDVLDAIVQGDSILSVVVR